MAGEWETVPLEQLVAPGRSISYGIVQPGSPVKDGIPIIRVSDVRNGQISTTNPLRVSSIVEAPHARTRLQGGELLLTLVGTVGETAVVPKALAGWNTARAVAVIPVRDDVGAYWIKLACQSPAVRTLINGRLNTTVQATLNLRDVSELPIVLPPARDRQLIVETLGAIDDKIELHRRMAETLEAIARTIFKSWFVDFDPVRAKIQGQPTGLPDDLAALFPDGFSEEGVPESWRYAPIVECFDLLSGGTPKTSVREYWDGHIPWFSVVDAPLESAPFVLATERLITQLGLENCASALLPLGTTIITARGTVGKLAIVGVPMAMNQSCYAAVPKAGYSTYFNYFAIRHVIEDLKTKSHGSVFSTITRQTFDSTITTLPPAILAKAYDHLTASLMNKIKLQLEQSRTLAALRDALLPKLISGELRIADADNRIVAA